MKLSVVLFLLFLGSLASAFNTLIYYPTASYSHQLPVMALTKGLVQKGHHVTVISPNIVPSSTTGDGVNRSISKERPPRDSYKPQRSSSHPKIKVFISQGGLQSFQESVHNGVPLIGIPWYGDQPGNVAKIVDAGIGVHLSPSDLNSYEKIKTAIEAVLFDQSYSLNMKRLSNISHEFTATGMEKAIFWVEHLAKHGAASYLRPSTAETNFFQFFCLDILSVILGFVVFCVFIIYSVCKFVISCVRLRSESKIKTP